MIIKGKREERARGRRHVLLLCILYFVGFAFPPAFTFSIAQHVWCSYSYALLASLSSFILFKFVQFKIIQYSQFDFSLSIVEFSGSWMHGTLYVTICFESRILFFSCIFVDKWNAYVFLHHKNVSKWTSSHGFSCMSRVKDSIHLLLVLEQ